MNKSKTKQITRLKLESPISDIQIIDGILYFTVDLGKKGNQRWQNNGVKSLFATYI